MRLNNEICISFLQGSGWMQNHDEKIKNEIIDKFAEQIRESLKTNAIYNMDAINTMVCQLKEDENKWGNRYTRELPFMLFMSWNILPVLRAKFQRYYRLEYYT